MILVHCALLCEAQSLIEKYKLKLDQKNPKIYKNNRLFIVVSGIGKENTISALKYVYKNFKITSSMNMGIAGCNNCDIKIGEFFCTNKNIDGILHARLETVNQAQTECKKKETTLYDMEAKYFEQISLNYIKPDNMLVFKIVSDYLDEKIQSKDYIKSLIQKNLIKLEPYL